MTLETPGNAAESPFREDEGGSSPIAWVGFLGGILLAAAVYRLIPPADPHGGGAGLTHEGRSVAALAVLMASWWIFQALPVSVTALLPLVLLPLLRVSTVGEAAAPYADKIIYLFLGGFMLGLAMQRTGLHRRIALYLLRASRGRPKTMVLMFMLASAAMSMWVSNTATAMMMMPIGMSVIALVFTRLGIERFDPAMERDRPGPNFATCVMLCIAYGASIGGVATLIGTPPNAVFAGQAREIFGQDVSFVQWMRLGVPLVCVLVPLAWALLVFVAYPVRLKSIPGGAEMIRAELASLGTMSRAEKIVLAVFLGTAAAWLFREPLSRRLALPMLDDSVIAILAAILLFVIPVDFKRRVFVLDWKSAERIPWGVLVLFGGGLSLAKAMTATGVDASIGRAIAGVGHVPPLLIVVLLTTGVVFLTEVASNTAVATALMPVLAGAAPAVGLHPYMLMIPAALAASLAFMLPVGTPPNAIVFSTGYVTQNQMMRAGFLLNLLSIAVIVVFVYALGPALLEIDLHTIPPWAVGK